MNLFSGVTISAFLATVGFQANREEGGSAIKAAVPFSNRLPVGVKRNYCGTEFFRKFVLLTDRFASFVLPLGSSEHDDKSVLQAVFWILLGRPEFGVSFVHL